MAFPIEGAPGVMPGDAEFQAYKAALVAYLAAGHRPRPAPDLVIRKAGPGPGPGLGITYSFDAQGFVDAIAAQFSDVAGYVIRLRQHGQPLAGARWGAAVNGVAEGKPSTNLAWGEGVSMHIASCSKTITAIALTKLLNERGIPATSSIAAQLPPYWYAPASVDAITYADLMTHKSGLDPSDQTSGPETYKAAREFVEAGPKLSFVGVNQQYRNINFILCRIVLATLLGYVPPMKDIGPVPFADEMWDYFTAAGYGTYVTTEILTPSGVQDAVMTRPAQCALAYQAPASPGGNPPGPGWNSGDWTPSAGAAGWHMSADDLLNVMGTFRRAGTIMNPAAAETMLADGYGIDLIDAVSHAGTIYGKNGFQWNSTEETEQCAAYFLPLDMELVVFVNSTVGPVSKAAPTGTFLMGIAQDLYPQFLTYTVSP